MRVQHLVQQQKHRFLLMVFNILLSPSQDLPLPLANSQQQGPRLSASAAGGNIQAAGDIIVP
jgi:hypothetical protein